MTPARLSFVIFDLDGTLAQTNELIFASFNHVLKKYRGVTYTPQQIIDLFGPPEKAAMERLFGTALSVEAMDELCRYYAAHHGRLASSHAGVVRMLKFLSERGVRLAVFTGKGQRTASITMERLDLRRYFDMIVSGDDVVEHKPSPEGIRKILKAFAVRRDEGIMVGDSVGDIRSAKAAGLPVASVVWDCHDPAAVQREKPDLLFRTVDELMGWLRSVFAEQGKRSA